MSMYRVRIRPHYVVDVRANSPAEAERRAYDIPLSCCDYISTEYEVEELLPSSGEIDKLRKQIDSACAALQRIETILRSAKKIESIPEYQLLPMESIRQALEAADEVLVGISLSRYDDLKESASCD